MLEPKQILQQRYQLKQKLAQNAGRQTWLAEDISIQPAETVILKFLSFGEQFQWQDLKLFEREAEILKQLSHHRIPKYRDSFSLEDNHNWFALVQEYIPGSSFKQLIESKQRFSEEELRTIATEVLEILCYLHTLNPQVIHRDIKPSNLMLGGEKQVYLIDFGAVQDNAAAQGTTFTVVGTYGYAPIEQFGGRTVPASDLYALGATLIHLATGIIPADLPQKQIRIQFQDRVSLSNHFVRWIEKLTEPDIEQRFSTAPEALKALNSRIIQGTSANPERVYSSRIKLKKSENSFEIIIPPREITTKSLGGMFILMVFLSLLSIIIYFLIYSKEVHLQLNQDQFILRWKIFGFTYRKRISNISEINDIEIGNVELNENNFKKIILRTATKEYRFGGVMTNAEREWLIEETKNWLGI